MNSDRATKRGHYCLIFSLLGGLVLQTCVVCADEPEVNHCLNPAIAEHWKSLIEKYPTDDDLRALVSLRNHLCEEIARGDITVDEATLRFETERKALMNKWRRQNLENDDSEDFG